MTDPNFDINALIENIKPNIVTPQLSEIVAVWNDKKPRVIAEIIIKNMHKSLKNPVVKTIIHQGDIHQIKYFSIEPLLHGPWAIISLLLLSLSYGEQATLIEAIYPEKLQLTAKAFAVSFTHDTSDLPKIEVKNEEVESKMDAANAGIAMIIAMLSSQGMSVNHPDKIKQTMAELDQIVTTARESENFKNATKRAQDASKYNDNKKTR